MNIKFYSVKIFDPNERYNDEMQLNKFAILVLSNLVMKIQYFSGLVAYSDFDKLGVVLRRRRTYIYVRRLVCAITF